MDKYLMLGLSTVFVIVLFLGFSGDDVSDYDYSGIAYDIHETKNGFTFSFDASDGSRFRCFCKDGIRDLGYYAISGDFSDDKTIYFIKTIECLDKF